MNKFKRIIGPLLALYIVLLTVNISINYPYYKAGGSWRFSIAFTLFVSTIGWLGYILLYYPLLSRRLNWRKHPTRNFALTIAGSGVYGVLIMAVAHKTLQFMGKGHGAVSDFVYAALFSVLLGLIIHGQDFLMRLQQSIIDNERMKLELLKSQHEALKAQVGPHFLFNALNTLVGIIPDDPKVAVQFVHGLSAVLRYALQRNEETIALSTELKVAASFLFLNKLRFGDRLHVAIHVAPAAKACHIATHSLLTLLENAVKHNEISAEKPLIIRIDSKADDTLSVSNGYQPKSAAGPSLGLGLPSIVDRYSMLTGRPVTIEKNSSFTVTIPLLPA
jgi:hypothetical protein